MKFFEKPFPIFLIGVMSLVAIQTHAIADDWRIYIEPNRDPYLLSINELGLESLSKESKHHKLSLRIVEGFIKKNNLRISKLTYCSDQQIRQLESWPVKSFANPPNIACSFGYMLANHIVYVLHEGQYRWIAKASKPTPKTGSRFEYIIDHGEVQDPKTHKILFLFSGYLIP